MSWSLMTLQEQTITASLTGEATDGLASCMSKDAMNATDLQFHWSNLEQFGAIPSACHRARQEHLLINIKYPTPQKFGGAEAYAAADCPSAATT
jgi:hypothetical protein